MLNAWRYSFRNFASKFPWLFFPLYNLLPHNRSRVVTKTTEIVIEGFPRSANSFAFHAFSYAQKRDVKIAHHLHSQAQIIKGAAYRIPICILIRNPADAIRSLVLKYSYISLNSAVKHPAASRGASCARCGWPFGSASAAQGFRPDRKGATTLFPPLPPSVWVLCIPAASRGGLEHDLLKVYTDFYSDIYPLRNSFVVASFEQVIHNFGTVIEKVNKKFNTRFILFDNSPQALEHVSAKIKDVNRRLNKNIETRKTLPSVLKDELKQKITFRGHEKLLNRANEIYSKYLLLAFAQPNGSVPDVKLKDGGNRHALLEK